MSENKSNSMLKKIQGLLDTYQSLQKENPEAAPAYLDKAEALMQKYAIDAAMLANEIEQAGGKREEPNKRDIFFMPNKDPLGNQWYNLYIAVAEHYDCKFLGWDSGTGFLVGFPSNMDLVEMMYTSLRLQALTKVDPKPDKHLTFDENVYLLHEAGLKWRNIAMLMDQAYNEARDAGIVLSPEWEPVGWDEKKKDGGKLIKACKRWCKEIGEPYKAVQSPVTFQRSYAQGFLHEVRRRLEELRRHRDEQVASTSGAELVLFDRSKAVQDMMDDLMKMLGMKKGKSYRQRLVGDAYYRGLDDGRTADIGQDRVGRNKREIR